MDIPAIRQDFPILQRTIHDRPLIYLDNAATTQLPRPVLAAVEEQYVQYNANVHRGVHYLSEQSTERLERARDRVRAFIHAEQVAEIVFTRGTTDAINLVARSYGEAFVGPGDEILVSEMEHHSNLVPWQMLCRQTGATLRIIPFDDAGNLCLDTYEQLLSPQTRLVAVTQVSNVLGTVNPLSRIIALAHERTIPVLVDGAQGIRHEAVDVRAMDCDFFCFSGHKMMGPGGIGVLYGKAAWLERMPPVQFGGGMVDTVSLESSCFEKSPLKFEAGTLNYPGAIGLAAAMDYLQGLGRDAIGRYESRLVQQLVKTLAGIEGVSIVGAPQQRAGVVSFTMEGLHPYDIATLLDKLGIAVRSSHHCAQPLLAHYHLNGAVRVSPAFYNTRGEIERFADSLLRIGGLCKKGNAR